MYIKIITSKKSRIFGIIIIKYLGRYLARAPIAEYKISHISDDSVTFFFYDLKLDKKKTFGINPFICPKCNIKMKVWEFYHYLYPPTRIYI